MQPSLTSVSPFLRVVRATRKLITTTNRRFENRNPLSTKASTAPKLLGLDALVEEESIPRYNPSHFYHPNPGEILDRRFELKAKIGWGSSSTVWLAQDIRISALAPYVAIKINNSGAQDETAARHELDILNHIEGAKSGDSGERFVRTARESFEIVGRCGSHICLVFELLREPIWLLRRRLGADKVSRGFLPFFKLYIIVLLDALHFLHTKCHIIHTDLKLDNILVIFEDASVIEDFIQGQIDEPMPRKDLGDRIIYLSHNNFGQLKDVRLLPNIYPKITDFGLAQRGDGPEPLIHPIQPDQCHAPEVILGTGWSYSADLWNFGIMVWDLLAGETLFQGVGDVKGAYSAQHHLAEMFALLGPVPPELIAQERIMRHRRWDMPVLNHKNELCYNVADYYGGPYFDDNGQFVATNLISNNKDLKGIVPDCIPDNEIDMFLDFMQKMLCWLPAERATAGELKNHPWLTHFQE